MFKVFLSQFFPALSQIDSQVKTNWLKVESDLRIGRVNVTQIKSKKLLKLDHLTIMYRLFHPEKRQLNSQSEYALKKIVLLASHFHYWARFFEYHIGKIDLIHGAFLTPMIDQHFWVNLTRLLLSVYIPITPHDRRMVDFRWCELLMQQSKFCKYHIKWKNENTRARILEIARFIEKGA